MYETLLDVTAITVAVWYAVNFIRMADKNATDKALVISAILAGQLFAFLFALRLYGAEFPVKELADTILAGFAGSAVAMFGAKLHNDVRQ